MRRSFQTTVILMACFAAACRQDMHDAPRYEPFEASEDVAPRPRGRVRDEAELEPACTQRGHRIDGAGDRLVLDVEHAVEVEQHGGCVHDRERTPA